LKKKVNPPGMGAHWEIGFKHEYLDGFQKSEAKLLVAFSL
jgi:hypothetical protein